MEKLQSTRPFPINFEEGKEKYLMVFTIMCLISGLRRSTEFCITDSHRTYSLKFKSYI